MDEEQYLSAEAIWFAASPKIKGFHNQRLSINDGRSETVAQMYVDDADPNGADAGKVCVKVSSSSPGHETEWKEAGYAGFGKSTPTTVAPWPWQRFLTQDAVNLIRRNEDGEFSLTFRNS